MAEQEGPSPRATRVKQAAASEAGATCLSSRRPPRFVIQPAVLLFQDYAVQGLLGEGRFGSVWKCQHRGTKVEYACKQIDKVEGDAALKRELQCFTRVQEHVNILGLHNVFESEKFVYLLTEFCDAGDLFDEINESGTLEESYSKGLYRQLVQAVQHCHTRGVMHRDIKPENVLLSTCPTTGRKIVKLGDFGLSTRLSSGEKTIGWVGSEPYEAPEVLESRLYDFSADVFSLGVVLFSMMSGTWPTFTAAREFDAEEDFSWPGWQVASKEVKCLITRMLSRNPNRRPTLCEILEDAWMGHHIGQEVGYSENADRKGMGAEREVPEAEGGEVEVDSSLEERTQCPSEFPSQRSRRSPLSISQLSDSLAPLRLTDPPEIMDVYGLQERDGPLGEAARDESKGDADSWSGPGDEILVGLSKRRLSLLSPDGSGTDISWAGSGFSSPSTASERLDSPVDFRRRSIGARHSNF